MNYLAHILLSGDDPDMQVGGLLGDFVKGPLRGDYPVGVENGIQLHRSLDNYADNLPEISGLFPRFPAPWRRYAGIVIDVCFDHLLARNWRQYHDQPLDDYCTDFYRHLQTCQPWLPDGARAFSIRAPQIGWLQRYAEPDVLPGVLRQVGGRFRKPVPLEQAWANVRPDQAALMAAFQPAMEKLLGFSARYREHHRPRRRASGS